MGIVGVQHSLYVWCGTAPLALRAHSLMGDNYHAP